MSAQFFTLLVGLCLCGIGVTERELSLLLLGVLVAVAMSFRLWREIGFHRRH